MVRPARLSPLCLAGTVLTAALATPAVTVIAARQATPTQKTAALDTLKEQLAALDAARAGLPAKQQAVTVTQLAVFAQTEKQPNAKVTQASAQPHLAHPDAPWLP